MAWSDLELVADFFAEDPIERTGVLLFSVSSWLVAATQAPSGSIASSIIQVLPPMLGIYVAHRSMERAHELRMEKLRQSRMSRKLPDLTPNPATAKPDDDTVDVP